MKRICLILALVIALGAVPGRAVEAKGRSALLMDVATGTVLFELGADEALAPASVTKVMTMLLIMEAIDSGVIGWQDTVTASETAAAKGGSQVYLKVGETMTVEEMLKSIAVSSANDCACAMAEHLAGSEGAFVEKMNQRAQELGMVNTHFVNCTGLDDDPEAVNHKTSARDIALMSRELLRNHPDITKFTTIWMDTIRGGEFGLSNTNKLVRFYDGATGLKTGFTAKAGYCLSASARREDMELIAVVMGSATSQDRFNTCKQLLDYGFANYALYTPEIPFTGQLPVELGKLESVPIALEGAGPMLVEKARRSSITLETELAAKAEAPVEKGAKLGVLRVKSGEEILAEYPLVAAETIEKLTWWEMFVKVVKRVAMAGD